MSSDKTTIYNDLYPQIKSLLANNLFISNLSTFVAVIYNELAFFWVGIYLLRDQRLIVGPYQGPVACIELPYNKGVCWHAIRENKTVIVPDVNKFKDHISCNSRSKSEIVIPIRNADNNIIGVLDIDSDKLNDFNETDRYYLEKYVELLKL